MEKVNNFFIYISYQQKDVQNADFKTFRRNQNYLLESLFKKLVHRFNYLLIQSQGQ